MGIMDEDNSENGDNASTPAEFKARLFRKAPWGSMTPWQHDQIRERVKYQAMNLSITSAQMSGSASIQRAGSFAKCGKIFCFPPIMCIFSWSLTLQMTDLYHFEHSPFKRRSVQLQNLASVSAQSSLLIHPVHDLQRMNKSAYQRRGRAVSRDSMGCGLICP